MYTFIKARYCGFESLFNFYGIKIPKLKMNIIYTGKLPKLPIVRSQTKYKFFWNIYILIY